MSTITKGFSLTALATALAAIHGPALAEGSDTLASLTKPDSFITLGAGSWSKDRHQQGIYDGMRDEGAYALIDGEIVKRDDATGTWFTLSGRNLGLDTREFRVEYLRQGNFGGFVDYSRIPRENPLSFNTGLQGIGTAQQAVTTVAPGTGSSVSLGTTRDLVHAGFYKNLLPGLDFKLSFKNEDKNGTRLWGRGGAPEFAVEPIDSTTRQLEALLEFTGERLQLSGGYYGTWYNNENTSVLSTGAACSGNQPASTNCFLSLPFSNEAHQAFLNGGYNFTPTTRGTVKLAYTRATQDETFPKPSLAGVPFLSTAPSSLDGKLVTVLGELGLSTRPLKDLSVVGNIRYHDLQDRTPISRFVQTNAACGSGQCVDNTPWSYTTLSGKLEGTYRLPMGYSLIAGIEYRDQDRGFVVSNSNGAGGTDTQRVVPFRTQLDETTYRIQARKSMSETVNGSLSYLFAKREGSGFTRAGAGPGGAPSDLISPIHIADRERDKWRLSVDWTPTTRLSLQFVLEDSADRYPHDASRPYGLRDGNAVLYSFDASYTVNSNLQFNAWYSHDQTKATQFNQRAATSNAGLAELEDHIEDTGDALGLGLRGKPSPKWTVGADVQWIRNVSKYAQSITLANPVVAANNQVFPNSGGITVAPLPDIENKLVKLAMFTEYAVRKNATIRLDVIHERWKTDDWSWLFSDGTAFTFGTTTDGTVVTQNPKQVSNFIGIRYTYTFQ